MNVFCDGIEELVISVLDQEIPVGLAELAISTWPFVPTGKIVSIVPWTFCTRVDDVW